MLSFERPNGGLLRFSAEAMQDIVAHRQRRRTSPEAGGVLLGRMIIERPDFIVDAVTVPSAADHRSRFAFRRAEGPTQRAINRAWETSAGERNYLGEWHTHPEDDPRPSGVDLRNWERLAREVRFEQDALFFVIGGRVLTRAWEIARGGGPPALLLAKPPSDQRVGSERSGSAEVRLGRTSSSSESGE